MAEKDCNRKYVFNPNQQTFFQSLIINQWKGLVHRKENPVMNHKLLIEECDGASTGDGH